MLPEQVCWTRYRAESGHGWYESFYQRANHPDRPLAFWLRYTLFQPKGDPGAAIGELWAVYFDGESRRHIAAKAEFPIGECDFKTTEFSVRIGSATLGPARLQGKAGTIEWDLAFSGGGRPVLLLPERLYDTGFPAAKSLVATPGAAFQGTLSVDGDALAVDQWIGSVNHNWGSRHTDSYAFGQVAGFDNAPGSFLEIATARTRLGPIPTPPLTLLVLRHDGQEHALNSLGQGLRATGRYSANVWDFRSENREVRISGHISAQPADFVDLTYYNPPGGTKHCRNTKIGQCAVTLTRKRTGVSQVLRTNNRALYEVLS